jgi:hypothetical protein
LATRPTIDDDVFGAERTFRVEFGVDTVPVPAAEAGLAVTASGTTVASRAKATPARVRDLMVCVPSGDHPRLGDEGRPVIRGPPPICGRGREEILHQVRGDAAVVRSARWWDDGRGPAGGCVRGRAG